MQLPQSPAGWALGAPGASAVETGGKGGGGWTLGEQADISISDHVQETKGPKGRGLWGPQAPHLLLRTMDMKASVMKGGLVGHMP